MMKKGEGKKEEKRSEQAAPAGVLSGLGKRKKKKEKKKGGGEGEFLFFVVASATATKKEKRGEKRGADSPRANRLRGKVKGGFSSSCF